MDGTFKVCPDGFVQLYTINGFLKSENGDVIQVPLVFIFMSRRQKNDSVAILNYIESPLLIISVEEIISDFERAIFSAVQDCFPGVSHYGCSFHWKQAVLRKAKQFGFSTDYKKPGNIRDSIQKVLCLPYLATEKIKYVFNHLKFEAPSTLNSFFYYISRVWVSNTSMWSSQNWSVYDRAIRTNNDCEGFHNRWDKLAKGKTYYWILTCLAA